MSIFLAADTEELFEAGFKGLGYVDSLSYRIVFHKSCITYPCTTWCSNMNKLFGFSRGFVPVMDKR